MPRQFTASQPPTRALPRRARGFVSPSWLNGKEGSRSGVKGKVQLGCGYLLMEDRVRQSDAFCLFSLLCPCLLSLFPESTRRAKGRGEREEERKGEGGGERQRKEERETEREGRET